MWPFTSQKHYNIISALFLSSDILNRLISFPHIIKKKLLLNRAEHSLSALSFSGLVENCAYYIGRNCSKIHSESRESPCFSSSSARKNNRKPSGNLSNALIIHLFHCKTIQNVCSETFDMADAQYNPSTEENGDFTCLRMVGAQDPAPKRTTFPVGKRSLPD